ncbi:MAG: phosphoketolase family protein [Bacilli bacterium]
MGINKVLKKDELININKYWNALNYLSVGQLYLLSNPLLKTPLVRSDIKKKIIGHWGTVPGQTFIYTHLNRIIKKYDLDMIYISGPGHGGNALVSASYLEGSYSKIYPNITRDEEGLQKLFKQFSFPGGVSSHVAPETPGSIHEGGELGYSLSHAFGAVLDNPNLIVSCVIGDGEAETGPLATSWQLNKFINPKTDGIVLPILHLNGYKISNPTVLSRITDEELDAFIWGNGWKPYYVSGSDPTKMHEKMAEVLEKVIKDIKSIKSNANNKGITKRPFYPMIVLRTPKGWTGIKEESGKEIEGTFRAHQVPLNMQKEEHIKMLEDWMKSYHPEEIFNEDGTIKTEILNLNPREEKLMGLSHYTNPGIINELNIPDFKNYALDIKEHGDLIASDMLELGGFIRDIFRDNTNNRNFRLFGPDETLSNRLSKVFENEKRTWNALSKSNDEYLSNTGRIMDSYLSEHVCEGMLEGYLLTGRHGLFVSYEAFVRVIDSMTSQHAKWIKVTKEIPWRKPIASLNYILSSNVWGQDHNGFTHQDPGFIDHIVNKKADIVRVYLPCDTNTLLSVTDHCLRSFNYVNVIVASKHPKYQWLSYIDAVEHCKKGLSIWPWASSEGEPDIVIATIGDTPTLEGLAAVSILKKYNLNIKIRFINIVDLMKLQSNNLHPHGLSDTEYDELFTLNTPIIFIYHGYPSLIRELTYYRHNKNLKVLGYMEEGTITTSFDMRVQNKIDRFHIVIDVLNSIDILNKDIIIKEMNEKLEYHNSYIKDKGIDTDEVINWKWE